MKAVFHVDDKIYADLLKMLNTQHFNERVGMQNDMDFIKDDRWLYDTAVIDNIWRRRGTWEINLVFAYYKQPLTFLCRNITQHVCLKRATMIANFMRRLAAKDQRGTLEVNIETFKFFQN